MKRFFTLLLLAALPWLGRAATISIVNQDGAGEGLNDPAAAAPVGGNTGITIGQQRLLVMQRAATIWGAKIASTVPIQVGMNFNPLDCDSSSAVLGSAGPHSFIRDFAGAPLAGTYYPIALANALAGTDLDTSNVDLDAQFNSNLGQAGCLSSYQWYYGLDGNAPANTIDLLDVVLHEFAHGLGFVSTVNLSTGAKLNGYNDPYMLKLEDHTTGKLYPNMTDAERLAASLNTGNLHWVGTNVLNAAGFLAAGRHAASGHVQMYAPNPSESGSSVSHWDSALSPDELMEPFANPVTDQRLTEQLFRDIGWVLLPPTPLIKTNGHALVSESCPNGAIDPGETVTVSFTLQNIGLVDTTNLTATLLASNGVISPGGAQNYGALIGAGPSVTRSFTFTALGVCGGTIAPTLHLQDGTNDYGLVSFLLTLGTTHQFTNAASISVPSSGAATPYPSTITISNFSGLVNGLTVRLVNINHNKPDDLDILLVGPGGQKVLLMSDAGGTPNLVNVTLTFSDSAAGSLADSSQLTSGTYKPTNYGSGDTFSGGPSAPYAAALSAFDGTDPNGTWQLFVVDDAVPTSGNISGGWVLILPVCCTPAPVPGPAIAFSAAVTNYVENAIPLVLAPDATVTDTNAPGFNGGSLIVALTTNGTAADQLSITSDGTIAVTGGVVSFDGLPIGNFSGGSNGSPLLVSFTSTNATPAAAQALCRAITFFNISDTPSTSARTVRFTLDDAASSPGVADKPVTVSAVNDLPAVSSVTNRVILEDAGTGAIAFTIGDAETAAASLTVSGTSSNSVLVPNANLVFGGSGSNRTVSILPATNQTGVTLITLFVSDGQLTNSTSFLLTVTPVNDAPTISSITNQTILEDTSTAAIPFTIGDAETAAGALLVSATSSNLALVPLTNIMFGGSDSNRTVTVTPLTNQFGDTLITLFVSDGTATNSTSFLLTVTPVNDAPIISAVTNHTILEDTGTGAVPFTIGDVETAAGALTVSATSSNLVLVPLTNVVFGGSDSNRTVTIMPLTNQFGDTLITLFVSDGAATNTTSFLLTVTPVNDAPTISTVTNHTILEDAGVGPVGFSVGDVETSAGAIIVSGISTNTALVPDVNLLFGGSGSNRTVDILPVTNQTGVTLITLFVSDGTATNSTTFLLTVTAVNDAPSISTVTNHMLLEDTGTGPVGFTVGDVETAASALIVTAVSSNLALVPLTNVVIDGSDSNRTVTITPLTNQFGDTLITLFVSDGAATNTTSFLLTVTAMDDPPTISTVTNHTILEDTGTGAVPFIIGDAETVAGALTVSATSSNLVLVPLTNLVFSGSDSNRTVTITPLTNQFGDTLITLFVSDGTATNSTSFLLTVTPVNDPPALDFLTNVTVLANSGSFPVNFSGLASGPLNEQQTLTVTAFVSDPAVLGAPVVTYASPDTNGTLLLTPVLNATGTTVVSVVVTDADGMANGGIDAVTNTFTVTVLPVADLGVESAATFLGTNLQITITVTNHGPHPAGNVTLTNLLPAGATLLSVVSDAAVCDATNGAVVCVFPSFLANTSAVVVLTLAVEPQNYFTNVTSVSAAEFDLNLTNNLAIVVVPIGSENDFDGDGLPDGWELANGTDPRVPDANDDPDQDGLTNLQEYLAGTNPHDAGSLFRITNISLEPGTNSVALSFLAVSNRTYSVLGATNLFSSPWEKVRDVPAVNETGVITITNLPGSDPIRFYRVVTPSQP